MRSTASSMRVDRMPLPEAASASRTISAAVGPRSEETARPEVHPGPQQMMFF